MFLRCWRDRSRTGLGRPRGKPVSCSSISMGPNAEADRKLARISVDLRPAGRFYSGSTAVHSPGDFYEVSAEAARKLGWRALLVGTDAVPGVPSPGILALPYAPYSQVFRTRRLLVHQGGSGTTGQALYAGRPQLIVPFGWDQPDNAMRVERLGVGIHLPRSAYSVNSAQRR